MAIEIFGDGIPSTGKIRTFGAKGSGLRNFDTPVDVRRHGSHGIFVADKNNHRVLRIGVGGSTSFGVSESGVRIDGQAPVSIALGITAQAGNGTQELNSPTALALTGERTLLVLDAGNRRIVRVSLGEDFFAMGHQSRQHVVILADLDPVLGAPALAGLDGLGNQVFVANSWAHQVRSFYTVLGDHLDDHSAGEHPASNPANLAANTSLVAGNGVREHFAAHDSLTSGISPTWWDTNIMNSPVVGMTKSSRRQESFTTCAPPTT